jgi:SNF2 family DNA or RNA helicase
MKSRFKLEIIEYKKKDKFILRANCGWMFCLDGDRENTSRTFSLPLTRLNFIKLKKILPDYKFNLLKSDFLLPKLENKELRPYQKLDVAFLSKMNSVAIFNEMRTGKTPTSLILTQQWSVNNLLIITPGILQRQWQNSVEEWLKKPAYIISELDKSERQSIYEIFSLNENFVIIISKETFKSDSEYFDNFRKQNINKLVDFCVIIDEAHFLRNYKSQQSESIYSLNDSKYKIVITGTPIVNNYTDIFGVLKFLKREEYNSYWKFAELFFHINNVEFTKNGRKIFLKSANFFKSRTSEVQLKNEISSFSVSRKQKDVLPWLPLVIREKEHLVMSNSHQSLYDKYLNLSEDYSLELLTNLKSVILYPKYLNKEFKENGVKIDYLVDICKENENEQILIFSTRSETFLEPLSFLLNDKKIKHGIIIGKIDNRQREVYISDFQSSKIKILLCNISSAGFGLNLNQADTVIFADRSYSPADNEQSEARFLPTKDEQNFKVKKIIDLVCKKTIDERILKLLEKKKDITKIINSSPHLLFD